MANAKGRPLRRFGRGAALVAAARERSPARARRPAAATRGRHVATTRRREPLVPCADPAVCRRRAAVPAGHAQARPVAVAPACRRLARRHVALSGGGRVCLLRRHRRCRREHGGSGRSQSGALGAAAEVELPRPGAPGVPSLAVAVRTSQGRQRAGLCPLRHCRIGHRQRRKWPRYGGTVATDPAARIQRRRVLHHSAESATRRHELSWRPPGPAHSLNRARNSDRACSPRRYLGW